MIVQIWVLLLGGIGLAYTLDQWAGHTTPVMLQLTIFGSFISYIYSAPPLKLKQSGWAGNYALGSSYIALPWWAGQVRTGGGRRGCRYQLKGNRGRDGRTRGLGGPLRGGRVSVVEGTRDGNGINKGEEGREGLQERSDGYGRKQQGNASITEMVSTGIVWSGRRGTASGGCRWRWAGTGEDVGKWRGQGYGNQVSAG